jgi:hypothetical protein
MVNWKSRRLVKLEKQSNIIKYIDNLVDFTDENLKQIIKYKDYYNFTKTLYLILKYKFGFIPKLENLKDAKGNWFMVFLEIIDLVNNKSILYEYIMNMEITDENIKILCKILRTKELSGIYYDTEIIDYIYEKVSINPKISEILEIIMNRNKEINNDKYLNIIVNNAQRKYIYQFNSQKQLFDYIDKTKRVSKLLLKINRKLFTNKEMYNFLKNKNYYCDISNYILKIKNPNIYDIKLLCMSSYFDTNNILLIIKIFNKYDLLQKEINYNAFFNRKQYDWRKYRLFEYILNIIQNFDFNIDPYDYFFEKELNISKMFDTLINRLHDDDINNYYDKNFISHNNIIKLLDNYVDIIKFSMIIGIKKSTKQQIHEYLQRVIKVLDEQWLYRNNINYKCFEQIFQILVDNI